MKAIEQIQSHGRPLTIGHVRLGDHGAGIGSPRQQIHDGDTISTAAVGNFGVRFLGVDAPEISYHLPGGPREQFVPIHDQRWEAALSDPWALVPELAAQLSTGLRAHLDRAVGAGAATNHAILAHRAEDRLEAMVLADMATLAQTRESFQFFLAFAHEVMDGYGRMLAFIHPDQPKARREDRLGSYNERLLAEGAVSPYFIWPNVDPFRRGSLDQAVPLPGTAADQVANAGALGRARRDFQAARAAKLGLFAPGQELRLQPFELRFLADARLPSRWLIDLSRNDDRLIPPDEYVSVANPEDRLFVPTHFVPLFIERGWKR